MLDAQLIADLAGPPLMAFCEQALPTFPAHPADTWTNIAPVVAGVVILAGIRRRGGDQYRALGIVAIVMGLCSAAFHGSNTRIGELADVLAMDAFASVILWFAWVRAWPHRAKAGLTASLLMFGVAACGAIFLPSIGLVAFTIEVVAAVAIEIHLLSVNRSANRSARFFLMLIPTMALALLAWHLDFSGQWCNPGNHLLSLHGVWHLLNGLPPWLLYRHYAQA